MGDSPCKTDLGRWKPPSSTASIRHLPGNVNLPAHVGVLLFTMLALKIGVVSIGGTGVNIACVSLGKSWPCADRCTTGSSRWHVDFVVAVTSLSLWAFFLVACVLGYVRFVAAFACSMLDTDTIYRLHATWRDHLEPFTVFCLVFLRHRVLDLFLVAYKRGVRPSSAWIVD